MTRTANPKPQTAELVPFKREERFIVVKRKHLDEFKEVRLRDFLQTNKIEPVECVVVESDWPEYETVWSMIEARCTGKPQKAEQLGSLEDRIQHHPATVHAAESWTIHEAGLGMRSFPSKEKALAALEEHFGPQPDCVFTIKLFAERSQCRVQAVKGTDPADALRRAMDTLAAEGADLAACPAHRLAHAKEQAAGVSSLWALLYLHNWDPKREDGSQPIYPEVHRVYATQQEAEAARASKIDPEHYWVRRAHRGVFADGKDGFVAPAPASSVGEGPPADVVRLVVAVRELLDTGLPLDGRAGALFEAVEAFSARVCYDDEGGTIPEAHAVPCTCGMAPTPQPSSPATPDRAPAPADAVLVEALAECARVLKDRIPRLGPEGPNTLEEQQEYEEVGGAWSMADRALAALRSPDDQKGGAA